MPCHGFTLLRCPDTNTRLHGRTVSILVEHAHGNNASPDSCCWPRLVFLWTDVSQLCTSSRRLRIVQELESDGRAAALQRTPAFVELAAVELEGYLSFRCSSQTITPAP